MFQRIDDGFSPRPKPRETSSPHPTPRETSSPHPTPRDVDIWIDGRRHHVPETLSVAGAVLLVNGWRGYRRHADGSDRAPLCMMGVCHDCLITIDGQSNRQGCLERVVEGMRIERQKGHDHD